MKRIVSCLVGVLLLSACSHIEQSVPKDIILDGDIVEKVVFDVLPIKDGDDPETKASAVPSADGKTVGFAWELEDMVGIYPDKGSQIYFKIEDGAGSSSASFDGGGWALKQKASYVSYYPFVADFFLSRDAIPISFSGQKQVGTTPPFSGAKYVLASAPATSENGVLRFTYNTLNTIINVNATLPAGTYTKASLTVDEPLFKEEGTFSLDDMEIVGTKFSNTLEIELENVTLTEEGTIPIYIMSAPVDLSGKDVVVRIQSSEGKTYKCVKNPSKEYLAGTRYGLTCAMQIDQPNNLIYYTSTDGNIVTPYKTDVFGANIVSNKNVDGQGIITFDGDVTSIGDGAFSDCYSLASITIPNSVATIGDSAFHNDTYLASITLPEGITSIGRYAFRGCQALTSMSLPESVTIIGEGAFELCTDLASITIPESVSTIGNGVFSGCISLTQFTGKFASADGYLLIESHTIKAAALGLEGDLILPEGVTRIEEDTFRWCNTLTNITLPNSLTSIGSRAFANCTSLSSITIPAGVTDMGGVAFMGCTSLTSIFVLPMTPPDGDGMFDDTNNGPIYVPAESVDTYKAAEGWSEYADRIQAIPKQNNVIYYTSSDGRVITPYSADVFGGATLVSNEYVDGQGVMTFDREVTSIGNNAFYHNGYLTSITIPAGVTSFGEKALSGCNALTSIVVDSENTVFDSRNNCNAIINTDNNKLVFGCSSTIIPDSVTSIGKYAFNNCTSLTSITLPEGLICIEEGAFGNCSRLSYLKIPSSVATIGDSAFSACTDLIIEDIPESLTRIGRYAFAWCKFINTTTYIPSGVISIGEGAFYGCTIFSVTFMSITPPTISGSIDLFCECDYLSSIYVPSGSLNAYKTSNGLSNYADIIQAIPSVPVPEAIDLGLPSGLKWASFNLGATKPEEIGNYYAWGEKETKNDYSLSTYLWCNGSNETLLKYCDNANYGNSGFVDSKLVLEIDDDVAYYTLGDGWRIPTKEEYNELFANCNWEWIDNYEQTGVCGISFTSKSSSNSIFIPSSGAIIDNSAQWAPSVYSWTASIATPPDNNYGPSCAFCLCYIPNSTANTRPWLNYHRRYFGIPIRSVYSE